MTHFFFEQIFLYFAIILTLIVPGYLVLHFFTSKSHFSLLERSILCIPISFAITTFIILGASYANVPITRISVIILLLVTSCIIFFVGKKTAKNNSASKDEDKKTPQLSKNQYIIICTIIVFMCLTKGAYLVNTIFPTSTDLGHHMYWVQRIIVTGEIVPYSEVIIKPDNPQSAATSPANFIGDQKIPDFIIGEHIIFAAIALLSGISVVSAMPSLVLFLIHIVSIATLFILSLRLFEKLPYGKSSALFVLFTIGALYAISGAQAKFVSGGVVGNILGNMLIISTLYFFFRALIEKNRMFFFVGILLTTALLYTHHLSMFIFGYVFIAWFVLFCILNIRVISNHIKSWIFLLHWPILMTLAGIVTFMFFVHMPSYLDPQTISGSVGSPSKSTRVGLPLWQLVSSSGLMRFFLGVCGVVVLALITSRIKAIRKIASIAQYNKRESNHKMHSYAYALIIGWVTVLLIMTLEPAALKVNILSTRIATYIIFPLAITAGFFLGWLSHHLLRKPSNLPQQFSTATILFFFFILTLDGLNDNSTSLKEQPETQQAVQTFHNALYLKNHAPEGTWSLKDHNHLKATAWMKVFMASSDSDYNNPLSRALLARYESQPQRENCTKEMITKPDSNLASICFNNLNISLVSVNTEQDAGQFMRNDDFIKVYENNEISTFYRK